MSVWVWAALVIAPLAAAVTVIARLLRTARGERVRCIDLPSARRVAAVVPVLDERARLGGCLDGLLAQPSELAEILIVDGGSRDGTQALVAAYAARDRRVRLIDASPVPSQWTGKAWGLERGSVAVAPDVDYVLCLDADVRPAPALVRALLAHAERTGVAAFSIAAPQRLAGAADAVLHPALLTTLVYRFGSPGHATKSAARVQANGQCFLIGRSILRATAACRAAHASLVEDVTMARRLAAAGHAVGFYEAAGLLEVAMYDTWRDTWRNWPRSLPMRDQYFGRAGAAGLAQVLLVQALPLPLFAASLWGAPIWVTAGLAALVGLRLGVLAGVARAYPRRPWSYWLSPLADLPVSLALLRSAVRHRHRWRGRTYVRVAPGRFQLTAGRSS